MWRADLIEGRKDSTTKLMVILYFVIYFIVGICVYRDYNYTTDESAEWEESIVAYKYINSEIFHRDVPELVKVKSMEEFDHRYYGTAMQMPMVFMEDLANFTLTTSQIFYMRHLITFLMCFTGYICFYFALKKIFGDRLCALMGVAMITLYPRFYGSQFTDLKNLIFLSLNMMVLLALVYAVEKENILTIFIFTGISALATNQRIMAVVFPIVLLGYWLVRDVTDIIKNKTEKKKLMLIGKYPFVISAYFLIWYMISPFAWLEGPLEAFINTFKNFSKYDWNGTMVFMGRIITCEERPWYYLPVWFGLTVPIIYLILFLAGHVVFICALRREGHTWDALLGRYKWAACCILLFWGIIGAVIISDSRIYVGWHHVYFAFMPFTVIMVNALKFFMERFPKKIIMLSFVLYMAVVSGWNIRNHPYQGVYFNPVGRQFATLFDREFTAGKVLVDWIMDNTEGQITMCGETDNRLLLSEDEKSRIRVTADEEGEYLIDNYRNVIGNDPVHEGYEEVYAVWVDGYKIGAVYRRTDQDEGT